MTLAQNPPISPDIAELVASEGIMMPPGNLESDEPELESDLHRELIELLLACLKWHWRDRTDYYATGNLTIFYSSDRITTRDFRGPDFFVVLGTENRSRRSWMLWEEEGKYPNLIVELLSNSTARVDRTTKKELYQNTFRTPEYFWFHPDTLEFAGFELVKSEYQPIEPTTQGRLWSRQLELFLGIHESKLRFFTPEGELVPTPAERAAAAEQQAQAAEQQAQAAEQQAQAARQEAGLERQQREAAERELEALRSQLQALGVDPDTVE
ncbi:MAG: Uma2 family endonuclease [Cyanobacteriota bacterium]|nr:Uma2 family endonuclease [Cyanobacteriota bacterium]